MCCVPTSRALLPAAVRPAHVREERTDDEKDEKDEEDEADKEDEEDEEDGEDEADEVGEAGGAVPYAHGDTLRTLAAPTRACTCGTRPSADGTVHRCWSAGTRRARSQPFL